jgi:hypothetical protein
MRWFVTLLLILSSPHAATAITIQDQQVSATGAACISQFDDDLGVMLYDNWSESLDSIGTLAYSDVVLGSINATSSDGSFILDIAGTARPRGSFRQMQGCRSASVSTDLGLTFIVSRPATVLLYGNSGAEYSEPSIGMSIVGEGMQSIWTSGGAREFEHELILSPGTYTLDVNGAASLSFGIVHGNEDLGRDESFALSVSVNEAAVPEPSTIVILAGVAFGWFSRRLAQGAAG